MDIDTFRGIVTLILMILFFALVAWAWSSRRQRDFTEAANLPLGDDRAPPTKNKESN